MAAPPSYEDDCSGQGQRPGRGSKPPSPSRAEAMTSSASLPPAAATAADPPPSPAPPPSPRIRKSVSSALFQSVKTHLTVVKAAIGHGRSPRHDRDRGVIDDDSHHSHSRSFSRHSSHHSKRSFSGSGAPRFKEGELYEWEAGQSAPSTPRRTGGSPPTRHRRNESGGSRAMMGLLPRRPARDHAHDEEAGPGPAADGASASTGGSVPSTGPLPAREGSSLGSSLETPILDNSGGPALGTARTHSTKTSATSAPPPPPPESWERKNSNSNFERQRSNFDQPTTKYEISNPSERSRSRGLPPPLIAPQDDVFRPRPPDAPPGDASRRPPRTQGTTEIVEDIERSDTLRASPRNVRDQLGGRRRGFDYDRDDSGTTGGGGGRRRATGEGGTVQTPVSLAPTWSWSEQFFFSHDDEDILDEEDGELNKIVRDAHRGSVLQGSEGVRARGFDPIVESANGPSDGAGGGEDSEDTTVGDDETCNNTIVEKVRQRGKKAVRASTVGAFVTFLKALFGIGMLSNPAVLGEVGLVLGTFCHLFIVVGCAFACYLLLTARQMAKLEVLAKRRRDREAREEYALWQQEAQNQAARRAGQWQQDSWLPQDPTLPTPNVSNPKRMDSEGGSSAEDWTVAPVPVKLPPVNLKRVGTSVIPPKEGWTRCKEAIQTVTGQDGSLATTSCGKVELERQPSRGLDGSGRSARGSRRRPSDHVSDQYQQFADNIHSTYLMQPKRTPLPPRPPTPPPEPPPAVRLVTYGDVVKYLAGQKASFFIIFTIVAVHLMFASGMLHLAVENLCYVIGWERLGWSYVEEYVEDERHSRRLGPSGDEDGSGDDRNNASRSSDEEEYYLEWKGPDFIGRFAMASLLFPIIHMLLQIPSLMELATISTVGLVTFAVGCIGSMLYSAVVLTEGHPFLDHPDDMWKTKWSGIPTYVATTIYCIEGINLALPTVSSIEGTQRWGGLGSSLRRKGSSQLNEQGVSKKDIERQDLSVFIVVGAVFLYGMVTLVVSWIGLAGGLGGGAGTIHGEDGCWDVTYCLNSSAVRFVYMLSLGVALVLTLPVILYPSTEMLEVWLDERNDERRRKLEAAALSKQEESQQPQQRPFWHHQKSLLPDDETVLTVSDTQSPRVMGIDGIEMREWSSFTGSGDYVAPEVNQSGTGSPEPSPLTNQNNSGSAKAANSPVRLENTKKKAKRKLKYWKLRMFLAFTICVIGTIEGTFPSVLKAAEVIRGVGLSIAGLIFPPLLYMSAVAGNFSAPMAVAMALLIGLGLFNIVLVLMSAFGARDFIVEEGRGQFYEL